MNRGLSHRTSEESARVHFGSDQKKSGHWGRDYLVVRPSDSKLLGPDSSNG